MSNEQESATTETNKPEIKATTSTGSANKSKDGANKDLQSAADIENEQGFRGFGVDPTPNENYTVEGVLAGKPTPETHIDAAIEARKATGLGGTSGLEAAQAEKDAAKKASKENK